MTQTFPVAGTVRSPDRPGVGGLRVVVIDRNVHADVVLGEAVTDRRGRFTLDLDAAVLAGLDKARPDLQARVYSGERQIGQSPVRYDAGPGDPLDVALPADTAGLAAEYDALTGDLARHYRGSLAEVRETAERPDVTYLANKSGWDARAVALAALAGRFAAFAPAGREGIDAAFYYALFRAGLPADPVTLYRADPRAVRTVWRAALDSGVLPTEMADRVDAAAETFLALGRERVPQATAFPGGSSVTELARGALGDDPERHRDFAAMLIEHRADPVRLWRTVRTAFGPRTANRLQLDGSLAALTFDNAPLIDRLHQREAELTALVELAGRGYDRPDAWLAVMDGPPPGPAAAGPEAERDRRQRYAELLAAQVKARFPTAVIAARVRSGDLPLTEDPEVLAGIDGFLVQHQGRFELGAQPVEAYLAAEGLAETVPPPVRDQIKRLQRLYQITPDDEAMSTLLRHGIDSAYRLVEYDENGFVAAFGDRLGGPDRARLVHAKAEQVHHVVLEIAGSYLAYRTAPALGADPAAPLIAPTPPPAPAAAGAAVLALPTLESLFGSQDYCECDHCRSVLSPAAYLVDLLMFLDRPVLGGVNPQQVLLGRRPDLGELPLTCENTNTLVPVIDLVNETLEYYVAHNLSIAGFDGYDTDDRVGDDELLAAPRNVDQTAYTALRAAFFPPPLPFHASLESLRRLCARLDLPLPLLLERLQPDPDAVERAAPAGYAWRDILMERLSLSREKYRLLTDRGVTLQDLYGYPAAATAAQVLTELGNVRAFTRRAGITIAELAELLRTAFINPDSVLLPRLERLRMPFATLAAYGNGTMTDAEFEALLPAGLDPAEYGGDVKAWVRDPANLARILGLLTIAAPPESGQDPALLELRRSDPNPVTGAFGAFDAIRLLRLLRLWRAIGWTIAQTDQAVTALLPAAAGTLEQLDDGFRAVLPRLGVLAGVMDRLGLRPERDLPHVLTCWSDLGTAGPRSLYRRLFLGSAVVDPAFAEDAYGDVLDAPAATLLEHAEALRAAFGLTAEDLAAIVDDLKYDATTPLRLATVSAVHRRGWLARTLRVGVRELLPLIRHTGIDPFAAPDPPHPGIVRLLDLLDALRAANLRPAEALYLMFDDDLDGQARTDPAATLQLARGMRTGGAAIDREFAVVDDPDGEVARARMTLVYGAEATDFLFGLLGNALTFTAPYSHPAPALPKAVLDVAPGRLGYDDLRKRLSFDGVPTADIRDALKAVAGLPAAFATAVDALYGAGQDAVTPYFARYPELRPLFAAYAASSDPPAARRAALLAAVLPELRRRRTEQQALTLVAGATGADPMLARAVLADPAVLHSATDPAAPAVRDIHAIRTPGLAARFYFSGTAAGTPDAVLTADGLDHGPGGRPLPAGPAPGGPVSAVWSGYLELPESGPYALVVDTGGAGTVTVRLAGAGVPLAAVDGVWRNQGPLDLVGGTLPAFSITAEAITTTLEVRWQGTGGALEVIPAARLYSGTLVDRLRAVDVRFRKAATIAARLRLTPQEVSYLASDPDLAVAAAGWLNALPVAGAPPAGDVAGALTEVLGKVLAFVRIRDASLPGRDELVNLLRNPAARLPGGGALEVLLGWDGASLDALLARFGTTRAGLSRIDVLRRVHDAYALVRSSGVPAGALIAAATNDPGPGAVTALEAALRARYDRETALAALREVNDVVRALRRDALVAYLLHGFGGNPATRHIDTVDRLFELFLMDVAMEPCAQTTRIRHALSAVQLFTERCLMSLEPAVQPYAIPAARWDWMRRYRVWEANRKVFLWPENWLEPDLRDDQSSFFRAAMSELLQGDVTEERAAAAVGGYLTKLAELAQLEPVGMNHADATSDLPAVTHVVARTSGARRKHYSRRRQSGSWTPWEAVDLDIEDVPVSPVIFGERLLIVWLKIIKEVPDGAAAVPAGGGDSGGVLLTQLTTNALKSGAATDAGAQQLSVGAVLCWSEYVNGAWQPPRTSDPGRPLPLGAYPASGSGAFDRSSLRLSFWTRWDRGLVIWVGAKVGNGWVMTTTYTEPVPFDEAPLDFSTGGFAPYRFVATTGGVLAVTYTSVYPMMTTSRSLLRSTWPLTTVDTYQSGVDAWRAPFFVFDSRRAYFVQTQTQDPQASGFGVVMAGQAHRTPTSQPLLLKTPPQPAPDLIGGPVPGATFPPGADAAALERFMSRSRTIDTVLRQGGTVTFDGVTLGPYGRLPEGRS